MASTKQPVPRSSTVHRKVVVVGDHTKVVRLSELVTAYRDERLTLREVGAKFGLGASDVLRYLDVAGVPRRKAWPK